ncbi:MAG TPA: alpha/beta fold hydrolase, partial [Ignavibacteria bacterium]|nr:alpha/beta fold hydrolase [Ignavibacteria bacterium]
MPIDGNPIAYAIFAHCFTCTKNLSAIGNISNALTKHRIAVLRFDFTGLGDSEGNFTDTNFSSNVSDLISAADYIVKNYTAPQILIGHSLGAAAALLAAGKIPSLKAVVTIGAPFEPSHIMKLIKDDVKKIEETGKATVSIGGRPFEIKKQFLDDLLENKEEDKITRLKTSLLILHSPQDKIVNINNAAKIYKAAGHPKSFIT